MERGKLYLVWSFGLTNLLFIVGLLIFNFMTKIADITTVDLLVMFFIAWVISAIVGVIRWRFGLKTDFNVLSAFLLFHFLILWAMFGDIAIGTIQISGMITAMLLALIPAFILSSIAYYLL